MTRMLLLVAMFAAAAGSAGCDQREPGAPLAVLGRTGLGPGEFSYPRAAAAAPNGAFYVVDKAARVQRFSADGEFVLAWQMPALAAGKPTGLGVDRAGNVYAADTHYARICVFSPTGEMLRQFGSFGDGPGEFRLPTDVAIAADGTLYVSEYGGNDRISKFAPDGSYLFSFGGRDAGVASLERPQALVLGPDGRLWVADACHHRICWFDRNGNFGSSFGRSGSGAGELRFPYGLDMLSDGTLIVTEYGNNRLQRFDRQGRSLGVWGGAGRQAGELAYPWAAVVAPGDRIFIVDSGNNRLQLIDGGRDSIWREP